MSHWIWAEVEIRWDVDPCPKLWDAVSLVGLPGPTWSPFSLSGAQWRKWESSQAMPVESAPLKRAATLRLPLVLCALCLNYGGDELWHATKEKAGSWLQWINALLSKGCHAQEMDSLLWPIHQPLQHPVEDLVSDESSWFIKMASRTSRRQEMWKGGIWQQFFTTIIEHLWTLCHHKWYATGYYAIWIV